MDFASRHYSSIEQLQWPSSRAPHGTTNQSGGSPLAPSWADPDASSIELQGTASAKPTVLYPEPATPKNYLAKSLALARRESRRFLAFRLREISSKTSALLEYSDPKMSTACHVAACGAGAGAAHRHRPQGLVGTPTPSTLHDGAISHTARLTACSPSACARIAARFAPRTQRHSPSRRVLSRFCARGTHTA